jgi:hypothetical protein
MNESMQAHYQLSDSELASQFEELTLTPSSLTHEAHIRLAWFYIKTLGLKAASQKLCERIQMFDRALDKGTKYHKTVTIAFAELIAKREDQETTEDFRTFIQQNNDLLTDYKQLLAQHYSYDLFQDRKARMIYVSPDLKSF